MVKPFSPEEMQKYIAEATQACADLIDDMSTKCAGLVSGFSLPSVSAIEDTLLSAAKAIAPPEAPLTALPDMVTQLKPADILSGLTKVVEKALSATTPKPPSPGDLKDAAKQAIEAAMGG